MESTVEKSGVETSGFLMGVTMAQGYGITLWFQGMVPGAWLSIPSSADLSRMMRSQVSEVIGSNERGMWDAQPNMAPRETSVGSATATK